MERIYDVEMIGSVGGIKPNQLGEKLKIVSDAMRDNSGDITITIGGAKLCQRK